MSIVHTTKQTHYHLVNSRSVSKPKYSCNVLMTVHCIFYSSSVCVSV